MVGIYKITNKITNKCYIGQSTNIQKRFTNHKATAFNSNSHSYDLPLYRAIRKYGIENFIFEIIEECPQSLLNEREIYWIEYFNSFFNGYNLTFGGDNSGQEKSKEKIIQIIKDLETTSLLQKDIAKKYNISEEMVQGINTGRYWHHNRKYPIRNKIKREKSYCIDCNKEIYYGAKRCRNCEDKNRIIPLEKMRVTREELKTLIRTKPFAQIAKQFQVSDNAIRKWCDKFSLPRKVSEIKKYSDEEWIKI